MKYQRARTWLNVARILLVSVVVPSSCAPAPPAVVPIQAPTQAVQLTAPAATADQLVYKDPQAPVVDRVNDLLARMTLDEKIGQMTQADISFLTSETDISDDKLGSLLSGGNSDPGSNTPQAWADLYDRYQSIALTTRLGIPIIYGIDAVHGHNNVVGATIFPHNIGLGATRNPALLEQIGEVFTALRDELLARLRDVMPLLRGLPFRFVRRPIYPLDDVAAWREAEHSPKLPCQ